MRKTIDRPTTKQDPQFDPFPDPVLYLRGFGIEAELVETKEADLPSAA